MYTYDISFDKQEKKDFCGKVFDEDVSRFLYFQMEERKSPAGWPEDIRHLTQPEHSPGLTKAQHETLRTRPTTISLPSVKLPLKTPTHVTVRRIDDRSHPAHTQFGLFANHHLAPSTLIVPYLGLVHSNNSSDTDPTSDYDLSLDREAGLSIDANRMGNEARMTNDYRGVPRPLAPPPTKKGEKLGPNAEFRDLWFEHDDGGGEIGIGIFVLDVGKSGKGERGILEGEEVLVNYGKGFWKERSSMVE